MQFKKTLPNLLLASVFAAFLSACSGDKETKAQAPQAMPVETFSVKKSDVEISFEYPAQLKSLQSVDVYARVEGTLLSQNFKDGGFVKEGDKLYKIDPIKYKAAYDMANAQLATARANYFASSRDWERAKRLFSEKALSPKEYDSAKYAYESAGAAVMNARANLKVAKTDLDYTDVIATASGKISMSRYDIGDLVGKVGGDNLLTTITKLDPIHAEFSIPNNDYYFIRELDRESVKIKYIMPNKEAYKELGKLDFIDSVIDANTATIKARAIVNNKENILVPGEFSRIRLEGFLLKDSIAIPQAALMQSANGSFVYKIVDGKATPAPITLGYMFDKSVVVKDGLKEGDVIITSQLIKIRPSAPVIPMEQFKAMQSQQNADSKDSKDSKK